MGHLYMQQYLTSMKGEDADRAIEFYKKAYALDPTSQVIGGGLAEMYLAAQRTRDAVTEVQEMLRRDPANLSARRLLARIYIRSLGDLSNAADQNRTVLLAIEQLNEIVRLDAADTDSALWLARLQRLNNQHDVAEKLLRGILMREPQNEAAAQQLTRLLLDENRNDEAIALLKGILQQEPSGTLYDELGDAYTQLHDLKNAVDAYGHAVELEPQDGSHAASLAQALFDLGDYQKALEQYQKLAAMQPNNAGNYLRQSEIYRRLNQPDKAEEQVLQAKQRAPGNLEVIYAEASVYEDQGRFTDAIKVLSDAVAAAKGQSEVTPARRRTLAILYQLLGQLYREADNTASAVSALQEMGRLGPEEDRRARALIIDAYSSARDLPRAIEETGKALKDYPGDRGFRITQALLTGESNKPDQAAELLRPMLQNSSADVEIYLNLAQVYQQGRRYDDAEKSLRTAEGMVKQPAERESVGFLFGALYESQKKYDQAEEAFKGVLGINPRNAAVLNYYGYMLADRGQRLDEAVSLVQRALAEDPTNGAYLDSMGWAYFKQGKLAEAESYLRKAILRNPHNPTLHSHLGDILSKSGHVDLAAAEWQKAVAEWNHVTPAEFESDKVAELQQKLSPAKRPASGPKRPAEAKP